MYLLHVRFDSVDLSALDIYTFIKMVTDFDPCSHRTVKMHNPHQAKQLNTGKVQYSILVMLAKLFIWLCLLFLNQHTYL